MGTVHDVTASSLAALTQEYRAISHNLANVSTAGYKQHVSKFHQILQQAGAVSPSQAIENASDDLVRSEVSLDFSQGSILATGRSLDVAIEGNAFFVINTAGRGEIFTRNGQFMTNANRQVVDTRGQLVAGEGGPLTIPESAPLNDVAIGKDGTISAGGQVIGKLRIVTFDNVQALLPQGGSGFKAPATMREKPATQFTVHQGFIENSNVSAIDELVKLIQVTRLYEAGVKSINKQDERQRDLLRFAMG
jgi:flagellar basal-body rod protein FlgF